MLKYVAHGTAVGGEIEGEVEGKSYIVCGYGR
jgi:hypothetical protein